MNITLKHLPEHADMVGNIGSTYDTASQQAMDEGREWYDGALRLAEELAEEFPFSVEEITGIIAVISGKLHWDLNQIYPRYIIGHYLDGLSVDEWPGPNGTGMYVPLKVRIKCVRILEGEDPRSFLGPKTGAFFANILGDVQAVTVDRWAVRVALKNRKAISVTPAALRKIADAYTAAAIERGTDARGLQATVWAVYRNGEKESG